MIYEFRYRAAVRGVQVGHLEALDVVAAEMKAQTICNEFPGYIYIPNSCSPWLMEPKAVALKVEDAGGESTPGKPGNPEQQKRLRAQAAERLAGTGVGSRPQATERVGA